MEPIPEHIIEQVLQDIVQIDDQDSAMELMERFGEEQPILLAYLMAAEHETYNQDERETLLLIGTAVWQMMSQAPQKPKQVTENQLDEIEEKNVKMVEYFMGESSDSFERSAALAFKDYNQMHVMEYVLEALIEEDEDDEVDIRDESKGLMFLNLKTVIDCLDQ